MKQFTLRDNGRPFRCPCGCNVFHKPETENSRWPYTDPSVNLYECNCCGAWYEGSPGKEEDRVRSD